MQKPSENPMDNLPENPSENLLEMPLKNSGKRERADRTGYPQFIKSTPMPKNGSNAGVFGLFHSFHTPYYYYCYPI